MERDKLRFALCGVSPSNGVKLIDFYGSTLKIFSLTYQDLVQGSNLTPSQAGKVLHFDDNALVDKEMEFIARYNIKPYFYGDEDYPSSLSSISDAPIALFVKGDVDFEANNQKWISFIGTRKFSPYGREVCERLIAEIAESHPEAVIVSGLAYGIDAIAHRAAMAHGLKTVAVVAHGLKTIYPTDHRDLAKQILASGGAIITEYQSNAYPAKQNFIQRNRIVAAIAAATVVIESPLKGGSLITADLADSYNREVFAVPGRITDKSFEGNIRLLKSNRANMVTSLSDIEYIMGWQEKVHKESKQLTFTRFILTTDEEDILALFPDSDELPSDYFVENSSLPVPKIISILTSLEIHGLIRRVKGRMYVKVNSK